LTPLPLPNFRAKNYPGILRRRIDPRGLTVPYFALFIKRGSPFFRGRGSLTGYAFYPPPTVTSIFFRERILLMKILVDITGLFAYCDNLLIVFLGHLSEPAGKTQISFPGGPLRRGNIHPVIRSIFISSCEHYKEKPVTDQIA
jgi:hypothetical protein